MLTDALACPESGSQLLKQAARYCRSDRLGIPGDPCDILSGLRETRQGLSEDNTPATTFESRSVSEPEHVESEQDPGEHNCRDQQSDQPRGQPLLQSSVPSHRTKASPIRKAADQRLIRRLALRITRVRVRT